MRSTLLKAPTLLLAVLALSAFAAGDAEAQTRLLGKVKDVEDAAFTMRAKGGTFTVTTGADTRFVDLGATTLAAVQEPTPVFVLGRYQEQQRDPNTSITQPPQVVQILAVVVMEREGLLGPPALSEALGEKKLEWFEGTLKPGSAGHVIVCKGEEPALQWGPKRPVILAKSADAAAVTRRAVVVVDGAVGGEKGKEVRAGQVTVVGRRCPQAQLKLVLGL